MRRLILLAALLAGLAACEDEAGGADDAAPADAAPETDGDPPPPDDGVEPPDGGIADADAPDALAPDAGPPPEPDPCGRTLHPDPDRPRVAVIGFPFGPEPGVDGTEIGLFTVTADGLDPTGDRLDVMTRPLRARFLPGGAHAVVLGEDGVLHTVRVEGPDAPIITDSIALAGAGWSDLVIDPDGAFVHAVRRDVGDDAGVYTVAVGCEGLLEPVPEHLSMRLVEGFALDPQDPDRALLIGGQTVFDPIDDDDTRWLARRDDGGWQQVSAFDLWSDFVDGAGFDLAPDGLTALVPNGSPISEEGGQVMVLDLDGEAAVDAGRLMGMDDARMARFHHGGTAMITRLEPGRVSILVGEGTDYEVVDELRYGLPNDVAIIQRGTLDGLVVLPAVSPATGSQLVTLRIDGPGAVREVAVLPLPEGGPNIPGTVAVAP